MEKAKLPLLRVRPCGMTSKIPHIRRNQVSPTGQGHENDRAATVIVCAPSAQSKMMGSLHPAGALYEKPVNTNQALQSHHSFVQVMKRAGITVFDVRDILLERVAWSVGDRMALENLAFNCLRYLFSRDSTQSDAGSQGKELNGSGSNNKERNENGMNGSNCYATYTEAEAYYVSDGYKRTVIEHMDHQQLVDIIFTHPTVTISPSTRDTGFTASYTFDPLTNIVFVRDQQITTNRGIVMARLRSPQRAREVDIMEFCLRKIGLDVIARVPEPGHLEGGDFFPIGENLSLLGIGPRTDWGAAEYLLKNDLFGTTTVGIVKDEFDRSQERMHLDTVFNVVSSRCCLMLSDMMGKESATRRMVDEYVWEGKNDVRCESERGRVGCYILRRSNVEFSSFMREKGFKIITVSGEEQLRYGCNVLNLGGGQILSIERNVARRIATHEHFDGRVQLVDFSGVTCMYGGVHCASQVVRRECEQGK